LNVLFRDNILQIFEQLTFEENTTIKEAKTFLLFLFFIFKCCENGIRYLFHGLNFKNKYIRFVLNYLV